MFGKKKKAGILQEVDDARQIVYDFCRRSHSFFESYRAVSYRTPLVEVTDTLKTVFTQQMEQLIAANAVDAGNADCLLDAILGPVRSGILSLEDQALHHRDFYHRYGIQRRTDLEDLMRLDAFLADREALILREHQHTEALYTNYTRKKKEEA